MQTLSDFISSLQTAQQYCQDHGINEPRVGAFVTGDPGEEGRLADVSVNLPTARFDSLPDTHVLVLSVTRVPEQVPWVPTAGLDRGLLDRL